MTVVMEAKPIFEKIKEELKADVKILNDKGIKPTLAAVIVGDDEISRTYVSLKQKDCNNVGINSELYDRSKYSIETREKEVIKLLEELNRRNDVHSILIQMPFPEFVSAEKVFEILSPNKDVDGLTPFRMGKLLRGEYDLENDLLPCTPKGIMKLLEYYKVDVAEKDAVIIGRSVLVGNPLRKMLEDKGATAECLHTKSKNILSKIRDADIVVSAAGRPPEIFKENSFRLTGDMIKEEVVVVGVGVKKDNITGKMYFDVDFDNVKEKASYITPNIGGVGVMTRAMLLKNTIIACERLSGLEF